MQNKHFFPKLPLVVLSIRETESKPGHWTEGKVLQILT